MFYNNTIFSVYSIIKSDDGRRWFIIIIIITLELYTILS